MERSVKTTENGGRYYKRANLTVYLAKRLIVLNGRITKETAVVFYGALFEMQSISLTRFITVKIVRSPGGRAIAGLAIYGMLRACPVPVKIIVQHCADSAACIIFQGAAERIMMSGSSISLHWMVFITESSSTLELDEDNCHEAHQYLTVANEKIYNLFKERTGMPMAAIKKLCKTSAPISPENAIKLGLADKIGKRRKCRGKSKK